MIEANFEQYAASFKGVGARVPTALSSTPLDLKKVLVIGSCHAEMFRTGATVDTDFMIFNGGVLGEPPEPLSTYGFQLIAIPLRKVLGDDTLWHAPYGQKEVFERIYEECEARLRIYFRQFTRYNREHGILTLVANFLVPAQSSNGRLLKHYDKRNIQYFIQKLNETLESLCEEQNACYMLDADNIANSHGKRYFTDESFAWYSHGSVMPLYADATDTQRMEPVPHIVEHFELFDQRLFNGAIFAEAIGMYRTYRQIDQVKMIVVDLDDTLWKGVSGDMSEIEKRVTTPLFPEPVVMMSEGWPLGVAEALLYCKRRGVMLGIISKNDETRIRNVFPLIFEGKLALDDFSVIRINWEQKHKNMADILATVNILPDNVLFIDDNPVERQSMAAAFPTMRIIGRYHSYTRSILLWSPETQVASITDESTRRTEMMQAQVKREEERTKMSEADFLDELNVSMQVFEIVDPTDPKMPRALELINKTNQWNSTGLRLDSAQVIARLNAGWRLFGFTVRDRFTQYGDVGFALCDDATVKLFVMSCRVIGLQVETRFLAEILKQIKAPELLIEFAETGKNIVIQRFLESHCLAVDKGLYRISDEALPDVSYIQVSLA